jgi:hypothetical protein
VNSTKYQPVAAAAPGSISSPPSISNWGPGQGGHLNAFVLGSDGSVWNNPFFSNTWHNWIHTGNAGDPGHPPGITITSAPTATSWSSTDLHIFARGSDNNIWYNYFHASTSVGTCNGVWSGWKLVQGSVGGGVPPQIIASLGFESGTLSTGWEWDKADYQAGTTNRLVAVDKIA